MITKETILSKINKVIDYKKCNRIAPLHCLDKEYDFEDRALEIKILNQLSDEGLLLIGQTINNFYFKPL